MKARNVCKVKNFQYVWSNYTTCLRMTGYRKLSARVVVADSWYGSTNSAIQLNNINCLHNTNTTHKKHLINLWGSPSQKKNNNNNRMDLSQ